MVGMMGRKQIITGSVVVVLLGSLAMPVHGYFQAYSFFNTSDKYKKWFHETVWLQDTRAEKRARGIVSASISPNIAAKYPYPDREFVMTENIWRDSTTKIEIGASDWFDAEVVRQRAEVEEYPPAMNFLAWMYEEGQGLEKDYRKAYTWYERVKLADEAALSGSPQNVYRKLNRRQKYFAQLQLADDIKYANSPEALRKKHERELKAKGLGTVKLHVLEEQPEMKELRKRRKAEKRKAKKRKNGKKRSKSGA